jgi:shikimate kinase
MSIFLTGYRGSGKTTVGRKLADKLWLKFIDGDDLIVARAGKSIREIFAQDGEPFFRDLESQVVRELSQVNDHVIALGAGAFVREENRTAIKSDNHQVIYLRCDAQELHRRIIGDAGTSDNRPALTSLGGGLEEIQSLLSQREPIYRAAMTAELDVTHLSPDEAVVYIVRLL